MQLPRNVWLWRVVEGGAQKRTGVPPAATSDGWVKGGYRLDDDTVVTVEARPGPGPRCGVVDDVGSLHAVCCLPPNHADCPHVGIADTSGQSWEIRSVTVRRPLDVAIARTQPSYPTPQAR